MAKRQQLRDLLVYALAVNPVFLPIVKDLRLEISVCDYALQKLYRSRRMAASR